MKFLENGNNCLVMGLPGRILGLRDHIAWNTVLLCPFQALNPGQVGNHHLDPGPKGALLNTVDQGL
jgi:hypothetical protein